MTYEKPLDTQQKKELEAAEEQTVPGKFYVPYTDIHETKDALVVTMEMPGVEKKMIDVKIEKNVLAVEGRIDFAAYEDLDPLYTEYNVGHYRRSFTLSSEIDRDKIAARVEDGVLTLDLPKITKEAARKIKVA